MIYNPPRRVAPWSIESPIYVRQGGVLLCTFSTCFCPKSACPCLLREKGFSLFAKTFFGTEVGVLRSKFFFREQLVLYTGFICSATSVRSIFLTVSSSSDPFTPLQLVFCFYRMYVTAYLLCTHRIVTFCYVDVRKHVRKSEAV